MRRIAPRIAVDENVRFERPAPNFEIARLMTRSERWVRDQWRFGRVWLRRELGGEAIGAGEAGPPVFS